MFSVRKLSAHDVTMMRADWTHLYAQSRTVSPMLLWEWAVAWWDAYQGDAIERELYVLAAYDAENALVGVLPLVSRRVVRIGIPMQRLEFIGTGEAVVDETCSELLDAIVLPDRRDAVAHAFADYLAGESAWESIVWRDVRADDNTVVGRIQDYLCQRGRPFRGERAPSGNCPWVRLPTSWAAYQSEVTPKRAKRIAYERRRLQRDFAVAFRIVTEPTAFDRRLADFERLHQAAWEARGEAGSFASAPFKTFMAEATRRLGAAGHLEFAELRLHGETVAVFFLIRVEDRLFYYNSGIASRRFHKYSIGNVALGYILENAITRGIREFHFFKAPDGSYKDHWSNRRLPVATLTVQRGARARVAGVLERRRDALKQRVKPLIRGTTP